MTSSCVHRPIVRSIMASSDRSIVRPISDHSWHHAIDLTINYGVRRSIARSIMASYDRSYDQSWRQASDRTIGGSTVCSVSTCNQSGHLAPVALQHLMTYGGWHNQLSGGTTSCTTNRVTAWSMINHKWLSDHARQVVRSRNTYLRPHTICNRILAILNMTVDFAATDFALAIIQGD